MTSPARDQPDLDCPTTPMAAFAGRVGAHFAAQLASVEHPDWCDRTRCEVRVGAVRHIGHPVYWHAQGDDVEFSLSMHQRDDAPAGYLLGIRHLAVIDTFEVELSNADVDSFPIARARLQLRDQGFEGDPREELDLEPAEVTAAADHG
jgi:hypothetical protein